MEALPRNNCVGFGRRPFLFPFGLGKMHDPVTPNGQDFFLNEKPGRGVARQRVLSAGSEC